jgi:hypothetical protein
MILCKVDYRNLPRENRPTLTEILRQWDRIEDEGESVESLLVYLLPKDLSRHIKDGRRGRDRFKDVEIAKR